MPGDRSKLTVFFSDDRAQGWSETWYHAKFSDFAAFADAARKYVAARRRSLAANCKMFYVRMSDDKKPTNVQILQLNPDDFQGALNDNTNQSNDAVNIRITGALNHRRSWLIRGIPDKVINDGEFNNTNGVDVDSPWAKAMRTFIKDTLKADGWAIKFQDSPHVVPATYSLDIVEGGVIRRSATRRTGRPFGLLPGRRLAT